MESGRDPESCGAAAVRGEAREGRGRSPTQPGFERGKTGRSIVLCCVGPQELSYLSPFSFSVSSAGHGLWGQVEDKKGNEGGVKRPGPEES